MLQITLLLITPRVRRREARQSCQPGQRVWPACELGGASETRQAREARWALQPATKARALEPPDTGVVAYARHARAGDDDGSEAQRHQGHGLLGLNTRSRLLLLSTAVVRDLILPIQRHTTFFGYRPAMLVLYACLFAVSGIAGSSAVSPLPAPLEYLTPADILRMLGDTRR